jgi:two-component system, NtrC family, response regulator GlrR
LASGKILIVDDDRNLLEVLKVRVESAGYDVITVTNEDEALEAAHNEFIDLAIIDLQLENTDGITLMKEVRLLVPDMPVIILTAFGTIENAVQAMRQGAYGYLTKPFNSGDLFAHIEKALEDSRLTVEINRLKGLLEEEFGQSDIVFRSEKMQQIINIVSRVAVSDSTVFVNGESGTGKELIAKAIHVASPRKDKPFVAINCAAIPGSLLESRLFGHEKGAFTGAIKSSKGVFLQAEKGTLFLDEIGDMALETQAKVLRVLQERQFYPIGSDRLVEVDVRIVVATNKNLEEQVEKGLFRSDLFYRIHVIPIYLPSLRERKEDIAPLVEHFLKRLNRQMKKDIKGITPEAMRLLMFHDWPGNVRELENTIEYAAAMTSTDWITPEVIMPQKRSSTEQTLKPLKEARDAFERGYLIKLLQICKGNVSEAADLAGRYRTDFYSLLKKHNLNPGDFRYIFSSE